MGGVHRAVPAIVAVRRVTVLTRNAVKLLGMLLLACCGASPAQVTVNNTRLVFPAGPKAVEFALTNTSKQMQTIRAWVDSGDAQVAPDDAQAPFFVMPPVSKIQPGTKQTLRISYTGAQLPDNQESLFYLNLLNLAPATQKGSDQNSIRFDTRSRFKLFFRPAGLPGDPFAAAQQLAWNVDAPGHATRLTASNPSPYFLTLVRIRLMRGTAVLRDLESAMVEPFSSAHFALPPELADLRAATSVHYQYIDDYGLYRDCEAALDATR